MKVELELPDYLFATREDEDGRVGGIAGSILSEAANQLFNQVQRDTNHSLARSLSERISSVTEDEIRQRVAPLVEQALTNALQPTDTWGQPKGEPVTLSEHITKVATDYLTKESRDRYGDSPMTVVQRFIKDEVDRQVKNELHTALVAAKEQVLVAVKERASEALADTIAKMAISR